MPLPLNKTKLASKMDPYEEGMQNQRRHPERN
jgi:hypothetical protein